VTRGFDRKTFVAMPAGGASGWAVAAILDLEEELPLFLADGWEPFALRTNIRGRPYSAAVWLRKHVEARPESRDFDNRASQ
jgi:hypothetical protein